MLKTLNSCVLATTSASVEVPCATAVQVLERVLPLLCTYKKYVVFEVSAGLYTVAVVTPTPTVVLETSVPVGALETMTELVEAANV